MKQFKTAILIMVLLLLAVCTMADEGCVITLVIPKSNPDIEIDQTSFANYIAQKSPRDDSLEALQQAKDKRLELKEITLKKDGIPFGDVKTTADKIIFPDNGILLKKSGVPLLREKNGLDPYLIGTRIEILELPSNTETEVQLVKLSNKTLEAVPEPSSLLALFSGAGALALFKIQRR